MQISRLFELVYLLLEKKNVTARELAEHFEVSVRTIYRDIEILAQSGIPIYANKGRGGGIRLLDQFVLNKSVLTGQERDEIMWALQGVSAVKGSDSREIFTKIRSLFGAAETNWIEVDFSGWGQKSSGTFDLIKQAVIQKRLLEFDYYNTSGESSHRITEPLQLWFKEKSWYMRGFCRKSQELRLFKLSRMRTITLLEEQFHRVLPEFENDAEKMLDQCKNVEVKLWIDASQGYRIFDEFSDESIERLQDGNFLAILNVPENDWVYSYVLSYGPMAKVLEPERIREIIKSRLAQTEKLYL